MWSRLGSARTALIVVIAVVAAGCGAAPERGVGVRSVATDIAFVPPEEQVVAGPAGLVPDEDGIGLVIEGSAARSPGNPLPAPPPPDCPFAPLTAAPEIVAPVDVTDRPDVGRFGWIVPEGFHNHVTFGRVSLVGPTPRAVREVSDSADGFTFVTEERKLEVGSGATVRSTYRVVQGSTIQDDGLYLTKIDTISSDGSTGEFNPSPAIMMFPLPAQIGESPTGIGVFVEDEQMDTTGVDPRNFASLHHTGTTVGKKQVDACGELVDAYFIEAYQDFVAPTGESYQRRYKYGVATHMGAMLVYEEIFRPCTRATTDSEGNCLGDPELDYVVHIGQLEPDPLPEG